MALKAGGEQTVDVDAMILATGSEPTRIPALSIDSPRVLDSTGALDLPEIPTSLLVIGGGYIGLELGSVYAALGTRVSVVEMTDGLLPGADRDLVRYLSQRVEKIYETHHALDESAVDEGGRRRRCGDVRGQPARRRRRPTTTCSSRSAAARTRACPASTRPTCR